jgi:hypothetical protein
MTAGDALSAEEEVGLRQIGQSLALASRFLDYPEATTGGELGLVLDEVESFLTGLACAPSVRVQVAGKMIFLRDELSAHILAAATLEAIDFPASTVVDLLRRAISAAEVGIESVLGDRLTSSRQ